MVVKQETPKVTKTLSAADIDELRAKGESWEKIAKRMGVSAPTAKTRYEKMKLNQPKTEFKEVKALPNNQEHVFRLEDRINELTKQLQRSKESYGELEIDQDKQKDLAFGRYKRIEQLEDENEKLNADLIKLQAELEAAKPHTVDEREQGEERYLELQMERDDLRTERNALQHQNAHLQEHNTRLREQVRNLTGQLDSAKEDQAAAEDHYQQELSKLNRILGTVQNYVDVLEAGTR